MCACEWGCCAIRIPYAKPLVPNGTSSPELSLASWLRASLLIHALAINFFPRRRPGFSKLVSKVPAVLINNYYGIGITEPDELIYFFKYSSFSSEKPL
jgi:hypothetical protein